MFTPFIFIGNILDFAKTAITEISKLSFLGSSGVFFGKKINKILKFLEYLLKILIIY